MIPGVEWIQQHRSRGRLIYPIIAVTLVYLGIGLTLAITDHNWRTTDTFSMVAGLLFFGIGTTLAVFHLIGQENEDEILQKQGTILTRQGTILRDVHRDVKRVLDLGPAKRLPSGKPNESKVGFREAPIELDTARDLAVSHPEAASAGMVGLLSPPPAAGQDGSPVTGALTGLELASRVDEKRQVLERFALESAIEADAGDRVVRDLLRAADIFVLGQPAGDTSVPGQGTESDILHFTVDDAEGHEQVLMPVFTRPDVMRSALQRNPDWQDQSVLQVSGGDLLANRDGDVTLVIDPWSSLEFQIPP